MKAFLGFIQMGLGVWGLVALFQGSWPTTLLTWAGAMLVGVAGNRMVRAADGVSESGKQAVADTSRAVELLRRGETRAATGVTHSIVRSYKMGGDKLLLPIGLTLHAVALAGVRDVDGSTKALSEAERALGAVPAHLDPELLPHLRAVHALVRGEIRRGVPDPDRLVAEFIRMNDN